MRIVERSVRFGMNHVVKRSFKRNARLPPGYLPQLGRITNQVFDIGRAGEVGVDRRLGIHPEKFSNHGEDLPDTVPLPTGHVVSLTDGAPIQQRDVGRHDVSHVEEVPHRVEVAGRDRGLSPPFSLHEPGQEARYNIPRRLTDTRMGKGPRNHYGECRSGRRSPQTPSSAAALLAA